MVLSLLSKKFLCLTKGPMLSNVFSNLKRWEDVLCFWYGFDFLLVVVHTPLICSLLLYLVLRIGSTVEVFAYVSLWVVSFLSFFVFAGNWASEPIWAWEYCPISRDSEGMFCNFWAVWILCSWISIAYDTWLWEKKIYIITSINCISTIHDLLSSV